LAARIYLDHAATTPILPAARTAMAEAMARWANPNSPHAEGRAARAALEDCRRRIRRALSWDGELIFTSGASEALDIALGRTKRPVLASAVEHDAVYRAAPGARRLPMDAGGVVDREELREALRGGPPPIAAIQHVNSETGTAQPVDALAAIVREEGGLLLSDCSQSAGKLRLPDADLIVLSAHKLGGPPGIGALLVKDFAMVEAVGGQEHGYRAGTQNLPGAAGFAAAAEAWEIGCFPGSPPQSLPMVRWLSDLVYPIADLEYPINQAGGTLQPAAEPGSGAISCGWIQAITMPGVSAAAQLIRFDAAGFALSAGSACASGSLKPSRVLQAFGVPDAEAACTIRVSFGWSTTADEIYAFQEAWLAMAQSARGRAA
jgi:cysteine desulfurase